MAGQGLQELRTEQAARDQRAGCAREDAGSSVHRHGTKIVQLNMQARVDNSLGESARTLLRKRLVLPS
jgi:hypothetical protein